MRLLPSLILVLGLAACGSNTVKDRSPKPDGVYEEFDVTMLDSGSCLASTRSEMDCPAGGNCQRPTAAVACPAGLAAGETVVLVMTNDLTCNVDGTATPCPEHDEGPVELPEEE